MSRMNEISGKVRRLVHTALMVLWRKRMLLLENGDMHAY